MQSKLSSFVQNIISEYKTHERGSYIVNIDDIDKSDKYKFANELIRADGCDIHSITENSHYDDIVSSLLDLLSKNDINNQISFSEKLTDKIYEYYKEKMQKLVNDELDSIEFEHYQNSGRSLFQHKDNGEYARGVL